MRPPSRYRSESSVDTELVGLADRPPVYLCCCRWYWALSRRRLTPTCADPAPEDRRRLSAKPLSSKATLVAGSEVLVCPLLAVYAYPLIVEVRPVSNTGFVAGGACVERQLPRTSGCACTALWFLGYLLCSLLMRANVKVAFEFRTLILKDEPWVHSMHGAQVNRCLPPLCHMPLKESPQTSTDLPPVVDSSVLEESCESRPAVSPG